MKFKKILFILLALITLATGAAMAQSLTPAQIKTALQNNKRLPSWDLPPFESRTQKQELCKLADQQANSGNYAAYYNAAVIYATTYLMSATRGLISHRLTATDMSQAQKYAELAINKQTSKSPDMYIIRALATERYLGIDEKLDSTTPQKDSFTPYVKKHAKQIRLIVQHYEKALEIDSSLPLWGYLYWYYEALGDTANATRCYEQMEKQNRQILEKARTQQTVKNKLKSRK